MSDIKFHCPFCDQHFEAPSEMSGQTVVCTRCKKPFEVPRLLRPLQKSGKAQPAGPTHVSKMLVAICLVFCLVAVWVLLSFFNIIPPLFGAKSAGYKCSRCGGTERVVFCGSCDQQSPFVAGEKEFTCIKCGSHISSFVFCRNCINSSGR